VFDANRVGRAWSFFGVASAGEGQIGWMWFGIRDYGTNTTGSVSASKSSKIQPNIGSVLCNRTVLYVYYGILTRGPLSAAKTLLGVRLVKGRSTLHVRSIYES